MEPSELLDLVKSTIGAPSDYSVAKQLEIKTATVSRWRNNLSFPDNEVCLTLAQITGTSPAVLLLNAAIWRARNKPERKVWEEVLENMPEQKH